MPECAPAGAPGRLPVSIPGKGIPHRKEKDCRRQKDTDNRNPSIPYLFSLI